MPEDTKSLKTGVLTTPTSSSQQARIAGDENRRQYRYVLDRFDDGFLFYYFGNVDQVSHMMWRRHGSRSIRRYDPRPIRRTAHVVEDLYVEIDAIVGDTARGSARTICSSSCRTTGSRRGGDRST